MFIFDTLDFYEFCNNDSNIFDYLLFSKGPRKGKKTKKKPEATQPQDEDDSGTEQYQYDDNAGLSDESPAELPKKYKSMKIPH